MRISAFLLLPRSKIRGEWPVGRADMDKTETTRIAAMTYRKRCLREISEKGYISVGTLTTLEMEGTLSGNTGF